MQEAKEIFSSKNTIPELKELGKKYEIYTPAKIKKADLIELIIKEYNKKILFRLLKNHHLLKNHLYL